MSLTQARGLVGLTQTELAARAAISVGALNRIEHGHVRTLGFATAMRIVRALRTAGLPGLTPEDVFDADARRKARA